MRKLIVTLAVAALCLSALPGTSLADAEYVLSLNLPIPPIHTRWKGAIKP